MPLTLSFIALGTYLGTSLGFLAYILFRPRRLARVAFWLAIAGFVIHTVGLALSVPGREYPFIYSTTDAYALISWVVTFLFIVLARLYHLQGAGAFFMIAAASLLILSLFGGGYREFQLSAEVNPWVLVHLLLAFMAFAVFLVSFVIGIAFIMAESRIKAKRLGGLVRRLPPLEVLDGIHYKALSLGLLLLTASIVAGSILNKVALGVFFTWDSKQLWVLFTWLLYAVMLQMRIRVGWRGRRGILLSILGFVIVILAFFGLQHGA